MDIKTLVLGGGGHKGIAYIGIIRKLEEMNIIRNIRRIYSVSIGSIMGLCIILGYRSDELVKIISDMDMSRTKHITIKNIINDYGLDSGSGIINKMEELIIAKNLSKGITFKELYEKYEINFQIMASNLQTYKLVNFNHTSTPDTQVIKAIRMSIGIPLLFTKTVYEDSIYIDGGLINNYPIDLIDDAELKETLGIKFKGVREPGGNKICTFEMYIKHVINLMVVQKDKNTNIEKYKENTIIIDVNDITDTINFKISKDTVQRIINEGYIQASLYFERIKVQN